MEEHQTIATIATNQTNLNLTRLNTGTITLNGLVDVQTVVEEEDINHTWDRATTTTRTNTNGGQAPLTREDTDNLTHEQIINMSEWHTNLVENELRAQMNRIGNQLQGIIGEMDELRERFFQSIDIISELRDILYELNEGRDPDTDEIMDELSKFLDEYKVTR